MSKTLTPEEEAYFETGGTTDLPTEYSAPEEKAAEPDSPDDVAAREASAPPADDAAEQPTGEDAERQNAPIPYNVLKEERERRRTAERQLNELNQRMAIVTERISAIAARDNAPVQEQKDEGPKYPDVEQAPMEALQFMIDRQKEADQAATRSREEQAVAKQTEHQAGRIIEAYKNASAEYAKDVPEFADAYTHLVEQRLGELRAMGLSEQDALMTARREEFGLVHQSFAQNQNPAARIMALAQARGWQRPQADAGAQGDAAQNNDAERLAAIKKGQEANASIGTAGAGASARGGKLTLESLESMSDKEFKAFLAKDKDGEGWRKAMGA